MYVPQAQRPLASRSFFVRTDGDPRAVLPARWPRGASGRSRAANRERCRPSRSSSTTPQPIAARSACCLAAAALIALLISTIGVYGVTAATTAPAGASWRFARPSAPIAAQLMRLVFRQALAAAAIGVAAGIVTGVAASSVLDAALYEVRSRDPLTFVIVAMVLLAVCGIASYLPARGPCWRVPPRRSEPE